jgi:ectoine hydroxylase-related dioxygenase (phytanoyl-CoA dioxygenase family)
MITEPDVALYREQGYLVVADVLGRAEIEELRQVTERFVEDARSRTTHDEVYDLEDSHSAREPRVRRIKTPHQWHEAYARMVAHPKILAVLKRLWGPSIRFDVSKLNLKAAGYGAPVEWHQDWAFYPHTNDDLAAVGIMVDDVDDDNGPLMVIPGSHLGPIFDHHDERGFFCGAIDPARGELDFSRAVKLTGPAGSITVHHARTVHGSATNTSGRPRRLLLHQYRAADAWPILGTPDFPKYQGLMVCGEDTLEPRLEKVPVRLPLPPAEHQGSIYENQKSAGRRFFQTADELEPALGDD